MSEWDAFPVAAESKAPAAPSGFEAFPEAKAPAAPAPAPSAWDKFPSVEPVQAAPKPAPDATMQAQLSRAKWIHPQPGYEHLAEQPTGGPPAWATQAQAEFEKEAALTPGLTPAARQQLKLQKYRENHEKAFGPLPDVGTFSGATGPMANTPFTPPGWAQPMNAVTAVGEMQVPFMQLAGFKDRANQIRQFNQQQYGYAPNMANTLVHGAASVGADALATGGFTMPWTAPYLASKGLVQGYEGAKDAGAGEIPSLIAGGIGAGVNYLKLPIAQQAGKYLAENVPSTATRVAGNVLANVGEQATVGGGMQVGQNALTGQPLSQNVGNAMLEAVPGGVGFGIHGMAHAQAERQQTEQNVQRFTGDENAKLAQPPASKYKAAVKYVADALGRSPVFYDSKDGPAGFVNPDDKNLYVNTRQSSKGLAGVLLHEALAHAATDPAVKGELAKLQENYSAPIELAAQQYGKDLGESGYGDKAARVAQDPQQRLEEGTGRFIEEATRANPKALDDLAAKYPNLFQRIGRTVNETLDKITGDGAKAKQRMVRDQLGMLKDVASRAERGSERVQDREQSEQPGDIFDRVGANMPDFSAFPKVQGEQAEGTGVQPVLPAQKNSPESASTDQGSKSGLPQPGGTNRAESAAPAVTAAPDTLPPQQESVKEKPGKTKFSRAAIERQILEAHEQYTGDQAVQDERDLADTHHGPDPYAFVGKLPGEIKHYLENNPAARKLFTVTDDPSKAGGADAFGALGDKYFDIIDRLTKSKMGQAKDLLRKQGTPYDKFLLDLHDTIPGDGDSVAFKAKATRLKNKAANLSDSDPEQSRRKREMLRQAADAQARAGTVGRRPDQIGVDPHGLQVGQEWEFHGGKLRLTENEDGERVIEGDGFRPIPVGDFPVNTKIPADVGTLTQPKEAELPATAPGDDIPFAARRKDEDEQARDLFGRSVFDPVTGKQQGLPFHTPAAGPENARPAVDQKIARKFDETATPSMFKEPTKGTPNAPDEPRNPVRNGNAPVAQEAPGQGQERAAAEGQGKEQAVAPAQQQESPDFGYEELSTVGLRKTLLRLGLEPRGERPQLLDRLKQYEEARGEKLGDEDVVRYAIAGKNSIRNLPEEEQRTSRDNLNAALYMKRKGKSDEEIRLGTGWFRSPYDGKWRYEIDDSGMKFTGLKPDVDEGKTHATQEPLGELIDHPALFKAYPDLKRMATTVEINPGRTPGLRSGSYTRGEPGDDKYVGRFPEIHVLATNEPDAKAVLVHEIQHAIQDREGFAKGGSTAKARELPEYYERLNRFHADEGEEADNNIKNLLAHQLYRRFAGEAEARAAEDRAHMEPATRGIGYPKALDLAKEMMRLGRTPEFKSEGEASDWSEDIATRGPTSAKVAAIKQQIKAMGFDPNRMGAAANGTGAGPYTPDPYINQKIEVPPEQAIVKFAAKRGDEADEPTIQRVPGMMSRAVQAVKDFTNIDAVPRLARASEEAGNAAVKHASARIAVPRMTDDLLAKVFPDQYRDPEAMAKTIDVLNKDNILGGYDQLLNRAEVAHDKGDVKEAEGWERAAQAVADKHDLNAYDRQVQAALADPTLSANIDRWKQHVNPELDQLYNEVKRVDPNTEREGRGRHTDARINLLAGEDAKNWQEAIADPDKPMPEPRIANYRNPDVKRDRFDRAAKFTGDYDTDARTVLASVLGPRWNEATKLRLYDAVTKSGKAVEVEPGQAGPAEIDGKPTVRMPIKVPQTDPETGKTVRVEKSLVVRADLASELRGALNTDQPLSQHPMAKVLTAASLIANPAEATSHTKNMLARLYFAPGAGGKLADVVRGNPVVGIPALFHDLYTTARDVMSDTPAVREELANMAKQGLVRPGYQPSKFLTSITEKSGVDWLKHLSTGQLIHDVDTVGRLILNRRYDNLVEQGRAEDTPESRRQFVNTLGQYNRRLMGPLMKAARDSGFSPFVVAGRTMTRNAVDALTGKPRFNAPTKQGMVEARLVQLGKLAALAMTAPLYNQLSTGSPVGRSGTPLGAIDLGSDDENGKHRIWDILQMTGVRRGLRATGAESLAEGLMQGKDANEIAGNAVESVGQARLHPWLGPAPSTVFKALTGRQLDMRGKMEAQTIPEGGGKQYLENVRAALQGQNPLLYALARPGFQAAGLDQTPDKEGFGSNLLASALRGPESAVGIKDVKPGTNAAEDLADHLAKLRFGGDSPTPEQAMKSANNRELLEQLRKDPEEGEEAIKQAVEDGTLNAKTASLIHKHAGMSGLEWTVRALSARDAARVYEVAKGDQKEQLAQEVTKKIAGSSDLSEEEQDELLDKLDLDAPPDLHLHRELSKLDAKAKAYKDAQDELTSQSPTADRMGARAKLLANRLTPQEQGRLAKLRSIRQAITQVNKQQKQGRLSDSAAESRVRRLAAAV